MKLLTEGKTKKIWEDIGNHYKESYVLIESKDDITAGDGARHHVIKWKGKYCNKITCNVFRLLEENGISTHYVIKKDEDSFLAVNLKMIRLEVVIRRIATGSCPKRMGIKPETEFNPPRIGLYFKCDKLHDPWIEYSDARQDFVLYDAHKPKQDGFMGVLNHILTYNGLKRDNFILPKPEEIHLIADTALEVFLCIERAWAKLNVVIPDLKIEFGYSSDGKIIVGDVIDNDSWRARLYRGTEYKGTEWEEMSKQYYRDLKKVTPEGLEKVRQKYEKMAELSDNLV